jgi:hypothetical protein
MHRNFVSTASFDTEQGGSDPGFYFLVADVELVLLTYAKLHIIQSSFRPTSLREGLWQHAKGAAVTMAKKRVEQNAAHYVVFGYDFLCHLFCCHRRLPNLTEIRFSLTLEQIPLK